MQAVCSHGLVAVVLLATQGKRSRWEPLLSWSYWMCVWQAQTDDDDCFVEKKQEYLLDLLG